MYFVVEIYYMGVDATGKIIVHETKRNYCVDVISKLWDTDRCLREILGFMEKYFRPLGQPIYHERNTWPDL